MISPKATRPSVSRSSRWYSTGTAGERLRVRVLTASNGKASTATGHLLRKPPELVSTLLEVAELVERRTGRGEQDGVAGPGVGGGRMHRGVQGAAAAGGHLLPLERGGDLVRRGADQVDRRD